MNPTPPSLVLSCGCGAWIQPDVKIQHARITERSGAQCDVHARSRLLFLKAPWLDVDFQGIQREVLEHSRQSCREYILDAMKSVPSANWPP
jgi:hypothetical protein